MSAALPQPEDTRAASGGRSLRLWGRLWEFFRGPFHGLSCIPFRREHEHSKDGLNVSLEDIPFRILPVACKFNNPPGKTSKEGQSLQWWRHTATEDIGGWRQSDGITRKTEQQERSDTPPTLVTRLS